MISAMKAGGQDWRPPTPFSVSGYSNLLVEFAIYAKGVFKFTHHTCSPPPPIKNEKYIFDT